MAENEEAGFGAGEKVRELDIQDELKESYLTYSMSVIIQRALPDIRDGLKPSQRRILVATVSYTHLTLPTILLV